MSDPTAKQPQPSRRRSIRRIDPTRLADFDEQLWPINLAVLILAGFVAGVVYATTDNFFDPRLLHNGVFRLSVVALMVAMVFWATAFFRTRVARRVQLCVILSLLAHLILVVFLHEQYLTLLERWQDEEVATAEKDEPVILPEYFSESITRPDAVPDFAKPVETDAPRESQQRYEVTPRDAEQRQVAPERQSEEDVPTPELAPAILPRAELTAPRRVETPTNPAQRQPWQYLPQPEEPSPETQPPEPEARAARELTPRAEAERQTETPQVRPQPELRNTEPSALEPAVPEIARRTRQQPDPRQPTTPAPTRRVRPQPELQASAAPTDVPRSTPRPQRPLDARQEALARRSTPVQPRPTEEDAAVEALAAESRPVRRATNSPPPEELGRSEAPSRPARTRPSITGNPQAAAVPEASQTVQSRGLAPSPTDVARNQTRPAPAAADRVAESPISPAPESLSSVATPRRLAGENRGMEPLSQGSPTGARPPATADIAALGAAPQPSAQTATQDSAQQTSRTLESPETAPARQETSLGLAQPASSGEQPGIDAVAGSLAGMTTATTRRDTADLGAERTGGLGRPSPAESARRRGQPGPPVSAIAARARPSVQPQGTGSGELRGQTERYEARTTGVTRSETYAGTGVRTSGTGGAESESAVGTGVAELLAGGLGPASAGSGSGTAPNRRRGTAAELPAMASEARGASGGRQAGSASRGLPGGLAAAEARGDSQATSGGATADSAARMGPDESALAVAGPAARGAAQIPLGGARGTSSEALGLGLPGGSLGSGGEGIGNRARAGEVGELAAAPVASGGGNPLRRGAARGGGLPGLAGPEASAPPSPGSSSGGASSSPSSEVTASPGDLAESGSRGGERSGPTNELPELASHGSTADDGADGALGGLTAGSLAGPRRLPGEGIAALPVASQAGGGPLRRQSTPGALPGMTIAEQATGSEAQTPTGRAPTGSGRAPETDRLAPTRREGGLAVALPREDAASGVGGLPGPDVGLPGRLARRESDVVTPLRTRSLLSRRAASEPLFDPSAIAAPAEAYQQRDPEERSRRAIEMGGGPETEEAVELGLAFLASIQFPDGHWSLDAVPEEAGIDLYAFNAGTMHGDTAATGLALLTFLGAGYTHLEGKYEDNVRRGLTWLMNNQQSSGQLFRGATDSDPYTRAYGQGIAAIALAEAYGMTRDPALRTPTENAVAYIVRAQHPELGGWRYQPRRESDTSVSGWQLMALKSAQMAGLNVPQESFQQTGHWLDLAQAEGGARYAYNPYAADTPAQRHGRTPNRAMTAEGLLMRIYLGWQRDHPPLRQGADFLKANPPELGTTDVPRRDVYYWYYATQVMFQVQGEHWKTWNDHMRATLLPTQIKDGRLAGSWDPAHPVPDPWAESAGRMYVTSLQLLMLEVYYRHLSLFDTLSEPSSE